MFNQVIELKKIGGSPDAAPQASLRELAESLPEI
jgi:hypothetical protein